MPKTKRLHAWSKTDRMVRDVENMIEDMDTDLLVSEFLPFCINNNHVGEEVFSMDMLDDLLSQYTPWEIVIKTQHKRFNMSADWFRFGKHDRVETMDEFDVREYIKPFYRDMAVWMVKDAEAAEWLHSVAVLEYLKEERA